METQNCIFCKIVNKTIPSTILYEDDFVLAFDDLSPKAPVHKLIIPKAHIASTNDIQAEDCNLLGHIVLVAKQLAQKYDIDQAGYRLVLNCNADAGQTVFHLHYHLLGGRPMMWPPG